jgi:N-acetylmuramoyl-L-alanine amidase
MIVMSLRASLIAGGLSLALAASSLAKSSTAKAPPKPAASKSTVTKPAPVKPAVTPSPDWQVIKVGLRDYLSADNIAKFYGLLGNVDSTGKSVVLNNGRNQLQLTLDSREAVVNGVRNWLCFPVIAQDGKFLVSRIDLAKTIEPQLRPQMLQHKGRVQTVVLDAGHGGFDKGALSSFGSEKQYALDVARLLRPLLQAKGFKVIMTRENDVFLPLELRARIANATRDSIFVSLHFNATNSNREATGFEIFSLTPRGAPSTADDALALHFVNMQAGNPVDAESFELSTVVYHSMVGHLTEFDRGIKRARFAVLRQTKIPAILIEGGFLTESGDSKRVADPAWRARFAQAICTGIENYRNMAEKKERPLMVADYRAQAASEVTAVDLTQPPRKLDPSPAPGTTPAPPPEPSAFDQEP